MKVKNGFPVDGLSEKAKDDDSNIKARLVARGYEENEIQVRKDSPTAVKGFKIRTGDSFSTSLGNKCLDIKPTFLHDKEIGREVFLKPPKGSYED